MSGCSLLHQMWPQRDALGGDQFEELANRCERVAGAGGEEDVTVQGRSGEAWRLQ